MEMMEKWRKAKVRMVRANGNLDVLGRAVREHERIVVKAVLDATPRSKDSKHVQIPIEVYRRYLDVMMKWTAAGVEYDRAAAEMDLYPEDFGADPAAGDFSEEPTNPNIQLAEVILLRSGV